MKAKYIIEALEAMKAASELQYTTEPKEFARIQGNLFDARLNLLIESGFNKVEIPIEKEAA